MLAVWPWEFAYIAHGSKETGAGVGASASQRGTWSGRVNLIYLDQEAQLEKKVAQRSFMRWFESGLRCGVRVTLYIVLGAWCSAAVKDVVS